ncbi:MAG TPA: T9SS type A sorting domain-containing protein [Bacteroidales bacterium]|nr:T9SS type A sorting domain-containing protein [Bacteroidales bacterium]
MKKVMTFLAVLFMSAYSAFPQGCLPGGIEFATQAEIDSFPANYPGCSRIEGNVNIYGNEITSLDSLYTLTSFGGDLYISFNHKLVSLSGLEHVTSIDGLLHIENNTSLVSLDGLKNLENIGGYLYIFFNESLTSLTGFQKLESIGQGLHIGYSHGLSSLAGLEKVTSIGGGLWIFQNQSLKSLAGIDNIEGTKIESIYIIDNDSLTVCDVKSICGYLSQSADDVILHDNAAGCNSSEEVVNACAIGIGEAGAKTASLAFFPNPASQFVVVSTSCPPVTGTLTIMNSAGELVMSVETVHQDTVIEISTLPPGLYFVRLSNDKTVEVGKFIKQ